MLCVTEPIVGEVVVWRMKEGTLTWVSPRDLNAEEDILGWGVTARSDKVNGKNCLRLLSALNPPFVWVQVAGMVEADGFLEGQFPVPQRGMGNPYRELKLGRKRKKIANLQGGKWLLVPPPNLAIETIALWAFQGRLQKRPSTTDGTKADTK